MRPDQQVLDVLVSSSLAHIDRQQGRTHRGVGVGRRLPHRTQHLAGAGVHVCHVCELLCSQHQLCTVVWKKVGRGTSQLSCMAGVLCESMASQSSDID